MPVIGLQAQTVVDDHGLTVEPHVSGEDTFPSLAAARGMGVEARSMPCGNARRAFPPCSTRSAWPRRTRAPWTREGRRRVLPQGFGRGLAARSRSVASSLRRRSSLTLRYRATGSRTSGYRLARPASWRPESRRRSPPLLAETTLDGHVHEKSGAFVSGPVLA